MASSSLNSDPAPNSDDSIDLAEMFRRLRHGFIGTLGLALLGLAVGAIGYVAVGSFQIIDTSSRVVFSFPGFERGEYPDKSKFSSDDMRSPEIVAEALQRKGIPVTDEMQATVRAALSIEGIIPDSVVKERDKLRAAGQTPRVYIPDEYTLTLSLPRKFPLSPQQREQLLGEIVSIYREKFTRTYVALPLEMGKAFESLAGADYFDYDLVLSRESQNIIDFLAQMTEAARAYRSPRTNFTFSDLHMQSQLLTQIRLNEVLGLIRRDGLSRNRGLALVKMDYYLKTLGDQELLAVEEEKVVQNLLRQAQEREQNYALGVRSQGGPQRSNDVVVDQGLVDSLLANDAYNFLVRRALDASLRTRRIQSEKAVLQERRNTMESFIQSNAMERAGALAQFQSSLDELRKVYEGLVNSVRLTYEDYQQQQYANAVRISMQPHTGSFYPRLVVAGLVGFCIGMTLGVGLSLLGLGFGRARGA
jgi:hypothetical protein